MGVPYAIKIPAVYTNKIEEEETKIWECMQPNKKRRYAVGRILECLIGFDTDFELDTLPYPYEIEFECDGLSKWVSKLRQCYPNNRLPDDGQSLWRDVEDKLQRFMVGAEASSAAHKALSVFEAWLKKNCRTAKGTKARKSKKKT